MADSDQDSNEDLEQRKNKEKLAHENYKIPTSNFKADIEKNFDEIHSGVEKLNHQLLNLFKKKEDDLCNMYKREMTKAQKQLRELQELSSESELNKRKIEKKEKLQQERKKFLEDSMNFSKKCEHFQSTLSKVLNTTKDLESEINFLNKQIVFADKHNGQLHQELENLLSKSSQININQQQEIKNNYSQIQQYKSPYRKSQIMKSQNFQQNNELDLQKAQQELEKQKEINQKLNIFLNDPCFQETEFEKIFMECVNSVKQKKNQQNNSTVLPQVKGKQDSIVINNNTQQVINNESTLDFTTISELDLNEFSKRQILEEFLSREEIKKQSIQYYFQ
ncbi:hypothetical protein IMG5_090790 [Ichthyophthirius multifiliis]|uniref:Uncharacterized protein n=1 Tax=Ichthyophthirius multifiliis TaxID=5932 RepID=G0QR88_ICHMU|nr:hypothetical protein IMG5_090790 [Ichthyophthirius multifiliis]EGR32240.1 hypothetical protein IMG5_090790 [Ichthyophthirius multifiliis]|eukprot:XP_004035726.1 hypothetical protein IMG5_090790 [Ichthyophthirius multifiliis]